jgi:phenylpropionate dioxygenase-like ring-hydroxylating dioxygenase large terminal subunit
MTAAALAAVDDRLAHAATPAPEAYGGAAYAQEIERVFRRGWISIARVDQLAKPGDYLSVDLFGEPLVAVRDRAGELRVLSRVCRHRAMAVVEGCGNRSSFQCPYHLWTFGLDGALLGAPHMEQAAGFDRAAVRLPALRTEVWQGWVFVNFDAAAPSLAAELEPLTARLAPWKIDAMRTLEPMVYDSPWNWKILVENFMESYHHAGIHPDTLQPYFPAATTYAEDVSGPFAILRNPARDRSQPVISLLPPIDGLTLEERTEFLVGAVFPFHLFSVAPDHVLWYRIEPHDAERFTLRIYPCVPAASAADTVAIEQMRAFIDHIHQQDIRVCDSVQKGLRSRFAGRGRYSHLEKALWQFHRFLAQRLAA